MFESIRCGDARRWIGVEQPGHQVLQRRVVALGVLETWMIERNPHSLGFALRESDELVADGTALAAHAAALAGEVFAGVSLMP